MDMEASIKKIICEEIVLAKNNNHKAGTSTIKLIVIQIMRKKAMLPCMERPINSFINMHVELDKIYLIGWIYNIAKLLSPN